jgi:hypothetical protein
MFAAALLLKHAAGSIDISFIGILADVWVTHQFPSLISALAEECKGQMITEGENERTVQHECGGRS